MKTILNRAHLVSKTIRQLKAMASGKGISKQNISKVFKPGFTTKKRGWGLGLTLVKRIVEEYHKGRVFVMASELDKGTTFRISIPHLKPNENFSLF